MKPAKNWFVFFLWLAIGAGCAIFWIAFSFGVAFLWTHAPELANLFL